MSKLILALYVMSTSAGLVLLKFGTRGGLPIEYIDSKFGLNLNIHSVSGIVLYGLSFLLYIYLISKNDLGYIIPLTTALVYVLIFVASYLVFHEVFTTAKVIAIALIISGVIILNFSK